MGIKIPGLLKSTAFQTGVMQNLNTRFDRMRENSEAFQTAARKKGQELFKTHKATTVQLQAVNDAKKYISAQFSPELADYMDSYGGIKYTAGMDTKDFLAQVDAEAMKIQSGDGIPEDFAKTENPYYGSDRYQKYETSYNQTKDFMDKNNNVFGNSFEALMEENSPTLMTQEQFGVTPRSDIESLNRSGLGAVEIDDMTEIRLNKQIMEFGGFESMVKQIGANGEVSYSLDNPNESQVANIAKRFANTHYRFNPTRAQDGIGTSATFGLQLSRQVVGAATATTVETALNDLANIRETIKFTVPGVANSESQMDSMMNSSISLYLYMLGQRTEDDNLVPKIIAEIEKRTSKTFVSTIGAVTL